MSAALDLPDARWEFLQLSGTWARENHIVGTPAPARAPVGRQRPRRLQPPAQPVPRAPAPTTTEEAGEVYGFSLVYSGNFLAEAEVDAFETTRVRIGISPNTFTWTLEPGDAFSDAGGGPRLLGCRARGHERRLHGLYRERLARGTWRDGPRPVLINNWEATYFGFDETKLIEIATSARDLGVELFVLDDGWFGRRDSDDSSLGDWFVDRRKLPNGLDGLAAKVEALGIELRPVDRARDDQRAEPAVRGPPGLGDRRPGRPRTESRQQFVLDMSRPEVVDHLVRRPVRGAGERADLVRQVGHATGPSPSRTAPRSRPTARASSSTASCSASTTCTPG